MVADAPSAIEAAHAAGLRMIVWTVDNPGDIRTLSEAGVDGIISNDPGAALQVIDTVP